MTEKQKPVRRLTTQGAFTKMVRHLREQGRRSCDPREPSTFLYWSPDGTKCPIGALIPDRLYTPELEHFTIADDRVLNLFEGFDVQTLQMMGQMRRLHDDISLYQSFLWEREFRRIAKEFGLKLDHSLRDREDAAVAKLEPIEPTKHRTPRAVAKALLRLYRSPARHTCRVVYLPGTRHVVACGLEVGIKLFSEDWRCARRVAKRFQKISTESLSGYTLSSIDGFGVKGARELLREVVE